MQFNLSNCWTEIFLLRGIYQNFLYTLCMSKDDVWLIGVCDTLCWPLANLANYPDKYISHMKRWAVVLITCVHRPIYRMIIAAVYQKVAAWDGTRLWLKKETDRAHLTSHWLLTLVTLVWPCWTDARDIMKIILHIACCRHSAEDDNLEPYFSLYL